MKHARYIIIGITVTGILVFVLFGRGGNGGDATKVGAGKRVAIAEYNTKASPPLAAWVSPYKAQKPPQPKYKFITDNNARAASARKLHLCFSTKLRGAKQVDALSNQLGVEIITEFQAGCVSKYCKFQRNFLQR